jgi:hypothetical protein
MFFFARAGKIGMHRWVKVWKMGFGCMLTRITKEEWDSGNLD